jgi:hypothetical protein
MPPALYASEIRAGILLSNGEKMKFIKSIETEYGGVKFRSRTEARWAIFFDALCIPWEYEQEGYEFAGVRYLPDFWLPLVKMFAEVKPKAFDRGELNLCIQLQNQTDCDVLMLIGQPSNKPVMAVTKYDRSYPYCLTNYHNYPNEEHRFYAAPSNEEQSWNDTEEACRIANSARFEFRQTPKRKDVINSAVFEQVFPI